MSPSAQGTISFCWAPTGFSKLPGLEAYPEVSSILNHLQYNKQERDYTERVGSYGNSPGSEWPLFMPPCAFIRRLGVLSRRLWLTCKAPVLCSGTHCLSPFWPQIKGANRVIRAVLQALGLPTWSHYGWVSQCSFALGTCWAPTSLPKPPDTHSRLGGHFYVRPLLQD